MRRPINDTLKDSSSPNAFGASILPQAVPRRAFWGLFDRRERWLLSWRGRLIVASALLLVGALVLKGAYPFLAITHRVDANILVIEGWVYPFAIQVGVDEFRTGRYERIFTTGGPVMGSGKYTSDSNTSASVGASGVQAAGVPGDRIQMVPSHVNDRDRTYSSAVALRSWFRDHNVRVKSINVVTENTHARRTRFLFQKAFGNSVTVGIIAARNPDYDPKYWWRCSEGVRDVIDESVAYIYAKLLFYPSTSLEQEKVREPPKASR